MVTELNGKMCENDLQGQVQGHTRYLHLKGHRQQCGGRTWNHVSKRHAYKVIRQNVWKWPLIWSFDLEGQVQGHQKFDHLKGHRQQYGGRTWNEASKWLPSQVTDPNMWKCMIFRFKMAVISSKIEIFEIWKDWHEVQEPYFGYITLNPATYEA